MAILSPNVAIGISERDDSLAENEKNVCLWQFFALGEGNFFSCADKKLLLGRGDFY